MQWLWTTATSRPSVCLSVCASVCVCVSGKTLYNHPPPSDKPHSKARVKHVRLTD